jgi:hypothetical protein
MVRIILKEKKSLKEAAQLQTFGDLKKTVDSIIKKEYLTAGGKATAEIIISTFPGLGGAKTAFDVFKTIYSAVDDKKTKTFLDKINVDDEFSKIVDDKVEIAFLKVLEMIIKSKPDNESLQNFNINKELVNYLSSKYDKRTLTLAK